MERMRVRLTLSALTAVMVSAVVACGGSQFTYVRDEEGRTYFKVPATWKQVDQKSLDTLIFGDQNSAVAQMKKEMAWTIAYDAHEKPSAVHLIDGTGDQPFVFAKVQKLLPQEQNAASLDTLRNAVIPVALPQEERQKLEQDPNLPFKNFELLSDTILPPKDGIRGVRVIYNYRVNGGPVQTFDQTAYFGGDGSTIHVMLLRCSAECYKKRAEEFDALAQSFTVKGAS